MWSQYSTYGFVCQSANLDGEDTQFGGHGMGRRPQSLQERKRMKVIVDFEVCQSHGLCTQAAPEVFELRDDGFLYILQETPAEHCAEGRDGPARVPDRRDQSRRLSRTAYSAVCDASRSSAARSPVCARRRRCAGEGYDGELTLVGAERPALRSPAAVEAGAARGVAAAERDLRRVEGWLELSRRAASSACAPSALDAHARRLRSLTAASSLRRSR